MHEKLYWVIVDNGPGIPKSILRGGEKYSEAVGVAGGNENCPKIQILGPVTLVEAEASLLGPCDRVTCSECPVVDTCIDFGIKDFPEAFPGNE